jgi:hypothetical protein
MNVVSMTRNADGFESMKGVPLVLSTCTISVCDSSDSVVEFHCMIDIMNVVSMTRNADGFESMKKVPLVLSTCNISVCDSSDSVGGVPLHD